MNRLLSLTLVLALANALQAEEIPLESVWAVNMPGTKDLNELDGNLVEKSCRGIDQRDKAGSAFAVAGKGSDALRSAFNILSKQKAVEPIPSGEVSIAFFTKRSSRYVHVSRVTVGPGVVQIVYKALPHRTDESTQHFALIPVGTLKPGKYKVAITAEPVSADAVEEGFVDISDKTRKQAVSSSFTFLVE